MGSLLKFPTISNYDVVTKIPVSSGDIIRSVRYDAGGRVISVKEEYPDGTSESTDFDYKAGRINPKDRA